jgi:CubicO group peptidase (beta-lactamase class C family)
VFVRAIAVLGVLAVTCPGDSLDLAFAPYQAPRPGASIAVIKDGAIIFERAYGLANLATGELATGDTSYRLASVTKQFTAIAILLLAERGELAIDDPVARHLPELARAAPGVTLRHLLTHTSGLADYEQLLGDDPRQIVDRDVLALIARQRPARPGTFHYSNTGYALLALVVERVTKLPFADFLRRSIFAPLGMTASGAYAAGATIPHRALGYRAGADGFVLADQSRTTAVLGDGGVYSSTHELARWIDALDRATLLPPARLAEATRAQVATDVAGVSYGLGFRLAKHRGEQLVFHTGSTSGFKNSLVWVPARRLAVAVLTNRRDGEPLELAQLLLDRFWDGAP